MVRASIVRRLWWKVIAAMAAVEALAACSLDLGYLSAGPTDAQASDATAEIDAQGNSDESAADASDSVATDSSEIPDQTIADQSLADSTPAFDASTMDAPADSRVPDSGSDGPSCEEGSPSGNIIRNWSFECGLNPWYAWSAPIINQTSAIAHTGSKSVLVSSRSYTYQGPVQDISTAVAVGHTYVASAYATVGAIMDDGGALPGPQTVNMTVKYTCATGDAGASYVQVASMAGAQAGAWTALQGTFLLNCTPEGAVELYVEGPEVGVDLYVDDVVLKY